MLELESRVMIMKRLSYLSKTYKNPATNERHMNGTRPFERRDSDRGSKSPFFTYYSFSDLEDFLYSAGADSASAQASLYLDFVLQPMLQEQAQAPQLKVDRILHTFHTDKNWKTNHQLQLLNAPDHGYSYCGYRSQAWLLESFIPLYSSFRFGLSFGFLRLGGNWSFWFGCFGGFG